MMANKWILGLIFAIVGWQVPHDCLYAGPICCRRKCDNPRVCRGFSTNCSTKLDSKSSKLKGRSRLRNSSTRRSPGLNVCPQHKGNSLPSPEKPIKVKLSKNTSVVIIECDIYANRSGKEVSIGHPKFWMSVGKNTENDVSCVCEETEGNKSISREILLRLIEQNEKSITLYIEIGQIEKSPSGMTKWGLKGKKKIDFSKSGQVTIAIGEGKADRLRVVLTPKKDLKKESQN